jgi:choline kinase
MNIIIPLGGKGERFKNNGYNDPKPLIKIFEKQMIFYVLNNLKFKEQDNIFIIYYNLNNFEEIILNKYPNTKFIKLNKQTRGAAETIMIGLEKIIELTNIKKCILLDCDTFYTQDILDLYRNINDNAVFYTKNFESKPIYSYIKLNEKKKN